MNLILAAILTCIAGHLDALASHLTRGQQFQIELFPGFTEFNDWLPEPGHEFTADELATIAASNDAEIEWMLVGIDIPW